MYLIQRRSQKPQIKWRQIKTKKIWIIFSVMVQAALPMTKDVTTIVFYKFFVVVSTEKQLLQYIITSLLQRKMMRRATLIFVLLQNIQMQQQEF